MSNVVHVRQYRSWFLVSAVASVLSALSATSLQASEGDAPVCLMEEGTCDSELYYTVQDIVTEEVTEEEGRDAELIDLQSGPEMRPWNPPVRRKPGVVVPAPQPPTGRGGQAGGPADVIDEAQLILDKIINLGKTLWKIVEAGRPVVNIDTQVAHALPQGITHWEQLAEWQVPVSKVYRMQYKNGYGMNVVDFSYRVIYTYGGTFNGKGRYLTQIAVYPADLRVAWGFRFDAQVRVPTVLNSGTRDNPVGSAEVHVDWSVKTVMTHMRHTRSYFVMGDGQFHDLSSGTPARR